MRRTKRGGRAPRFAVWLAAVGLLAPVPFVLAACVDETVVLATLPLESDEDATVPIPKSCYDSNDCLDGFCNKPSCGLLVEGKCVRFPSVCTDEEQPRCGCDNVTFLNDCLRKRAGVESSTDGECPTPQLCDSPEDCPEYATCAWLSGMGSSTCTLKTGSCWSIPRQCSGNGTKRWNECNNPGGSKCLSTCAAVNNGHRFYESRGCESD